MSYGNIPAFIRSSLEGNRAVRLTFGDVQSSNLTSASSSFAYDPYDVGIKSSQQYFVDWSAFENHTFFNSAQVKTNVAFDNIINYYPFDGTRQETEAFFEKLTGYEKWVLDGFPTFKGELQFSGTRYGIDQTTSKGTYITVNDYAGGLFPDLSKTKTGEKAIDPNTGSLSIECNIYVPRLENHWQIICQKRYDSTHGLSLFLSYSAAATTNALLYFGVVSGSTSLMTSCSLEKNSFKHICATYDGESTDKKVILYKDGDLRSSSSTTYAFGDLGIKSAQFMIGSGSAMTFNGTSYLPVTTFVRLEHPVNKNRTFKSQCMRFLRWHYITSSMSRQHHSCSRRQVH
jgi:hypothetical protein